MNNLPSKYILDTQLTYIPVCHFLTLFRENWMQRKRIIANFPPHNVPTFAAQQEQGLWILQRLYSNLIPLEACDVPWESGNKNFTIW